MTADPTPNPLQEGRGDTRTARDLASAEAALRRAGWVRAREAVAANPAPATISARLSQFKSDYQALSEFAKEFVQPQKNPILEFFETEAGTVAMKELVPVLTEKLFGGDGSAVKSNPNIEALNARIARVEAAVAQIVTALKSTEQ